MTLDTELEALRARYPDGNIVWAEKGWMVTVLIEKDEEFQELVGEGITLEAALIDLQTQLLPLD